MSLKKVLLFPLLFSSFVFAEEISLSLNEAVDYALKNNLNLQQNNIAMEKSRREKNSSWNFLIPSLSLSASYSDSVAVDNSNPMTNPDGKGSLSFGGTASLNLVPSLFNTIKNAKILFEKQQIDYTKAVRSVEVNVRKMYYSILFEEEQIRLLEKVLETNKSQYDSILAKYNRGVTSRLDLLNAQVSFQTSQVNLDTAISTYKTDLNSYKQILGIPLNAELKLKGTLDEIRNIKEIDYASINVHSSSVESAKKTVAAAKNSLTGNRLASYAPSISASYRYSQSGLAGEDLTASDSITVSASLPLDSYIPWSAKGQALKTLKENVQNAELALQNEEKSLELNVQSLIEKIEQSKKNIKLRESSIELAQASYEMTVDAYNHGTKDLLALQNSLDSLNSTKLNLMKESYALACAVLDLENTAGIDFGTLGK